VVNLSWVRLAAPPADAYNAPMLFTLAFPAIDPVLIQFGPFAIRWYALAYVVGILLGWTYTRRLARRGAFASLAGSINRLCFALRHRRGQLAGAAVLRTAIVIALPTDGLERMAVMGRAEAAGEDLDQLGVSLLDVGRVGLALELGGLVAEVDRVGPSMLLERDQPEVVPGLPVEPIIVHGAAEVVVRREHLVVLVIFHPPLREDLCRQLLELQIVGIRGQRALDLGSCVVKFSPRQRALRAALMVHRAGRKYRAAEKYRAQEK